MRDPWFERALILLCQHDEDGALGLVINRESDIVLQEVVDKLAEDHGDFGALQDGDRPTWWGGPVGDGAGFVLFPGAVEDGEGWSIDGVAISPSLERLADLIRTGVAFELCLGYAGWGPGQLADEIATGSWVPVDIDPKIVFETPLDERYDKALAQLGVALNQVWMQPIDE